MTSNKTEKAQTESMDGKDHVVAGLLFLANTLGLKKIMFDFIQYPGPENGNSLVCQVTAQVMGENNNGKTKAPAQTQTGPSNGDKTSQNQPNNGKTIPKMSSAQRRAILNMSRRRKLSTDELEKLVQKTYKTPFNNLSIADASNLIQFLAD